jgi:acyl carrier protein
MEDKFIALFIEAVELENQVVTMEHKFREYEEWDSLAQLSLIATLDEEFGVAIEDEDFQKLETVGDLYKEILKHSS